MVPVDPRHLYGSILAAFPRLGRAPSLAELADEIQAGQDAIKANLRYLEERGALKLDCASAEIRDAYPYSAVPTRHTVKLGKGPRLHCMCAIDVFYVPFLTQSDVSIESRCHYCDAVIQITVKGEEITEAVPSTTVVWDSAAKYDCPLTNFFCRREHLELWLEGFPGEPGQSLGLMMALERGRTAATRIRGELAEYQQPPSGESDSAMMDR